MGIQVEDSMNPVEPEPVKDDAVEAGGRSQAPPHAARRVDINFPHELSERVAEDELAALGLECDQDRALFDLPPGPKDA